MNDMATGAGGRDIVARGTRGEGRPGGLAGGGVVVLFFSCRLLFGRLAVLFSHQLKDAIYIILHMSSHII